MGMIPSAPLVLIDVKTREGVIGSAYIFAYTPPALAALNGLVAAIGAELTGMAVAPRDIMRHFDRRFRLLGWQGLVGMAVSGIDMALWDALGRAAGEPVVRLLGGSPRPLETYDSYGAIDPDSDAAMLQCSVEAGFKAIKIKTCPGAYHALGTRPRPHLGRKSRCAICSGVTRLILAPFMSVGEQTIGICSRRRAYLKSEDLAFIRPCQLPQDRP
jgi:L-alanine-DL-glutamate epimerase-like enolase superfamily enzyme